MDYKRKMKIFDGKTTLQKSTNTICRILRSFSLPQNDSYVGFFRGLRRLMMPLAVMVAVTGLAFLDTSATGINTDAASRLLWAESEGVVEYEYFCAMHPQVVSDKPGKCPICGMPLSKRTKAGRGTEEEGLPEVPMVQLSPRQVRLAGVKVEPVTYRDLVKTIYTVGNMTYDERRLAYVTAWVGGRVDKLFVDFTGLEVKEGEPLVWIYSPELVSAQQEYLLALETREKMKSSSLDEIVRSTDYLFDASRDKLLLLGITEKQIQELAETGEVQDHMTIYAPITGTVIKKDILKGQYVKEGTQMYTISDLTELWMMADVYEYEMSLVKLGQKVEITTAAFPGQTFTGTIIFIDPFLNETTRSLKVRVDVPNPERKLKPAMFVNVTIKVPLVDLKELAKRPAGVLSIQRSAVLDTGLRKLVYVERKKDLFEPREIVTGFKAEGYVEVLEGLTEGEKVVTRGAFLIDAESQLGPGVGTQYFGATGGPEKVAPPPHAHGVAPRTRAPKKPEKLKKEKEDKKITKAPAEVSKETRPVPRGTTPVDPVCGMTLEGFEELSTESDGKLFYFCTEDCRKKFEDDPDSFINKTWAFNIGNTVDLVCGIRLDKSRGTKFTYRDKEYYFCCNHCKRLFKKNPEEYLTKEILGEGQELHRH